MLREDVRFKAEPMVNRYTFNTELVGFVNVLRTEGNTTTDLLAIKVK